MIKYFTSRMNYYRDWWKSAESFSQVIETLKCDLYVWDDDSAGCDSIKIAVDNNGEISYYVLINEWYDSYDAPEIVNDFYINDAEPFFVPKVRRDWLLV